MDKKLSDNKETLLPPSKTEELNMPTDREERLEWVRQSYERFFEKVRENDAFLKPIELN
ncbi:MAG: hypothetical protein K2W82_00930 [Candidatus Obscuribacterales bacterium]|nr:hypothetical protein [Candidatus Obscuribacterales bacterium]